MASVDYRPDIDGLRAVSVLAVALFHYRVPGFDGGFVGVDVFFVISGFLITSLILKDQTEGRFSLVQFYERRVRRILPALFVVVAVSAILAVLLFLPEDLDEFGESLPATAGFISNLYFWHQVNYFAAAAETRPLMHTWSLAVEEQFYLAFPLLMIVLRNARPRILAMTLAGVGIVSLVASQWAVMTYPRAAFFLTPFRAFELMAGALAALPAARLAQGLLSRIPQGSVLGLGLILAAAFLYSRVTPFPGIAALLPCAGTLLVILSRGDAGSKLLSRRPFVAVGLVSYSFYLWHWPALVFASYWAEGPLPLTTRLAILVGVLLLSAATWRFVEQPFRRRRALPVRAVLFATAGLASVFVAGLGAAMVMLQGLPGRMPPAALAVLEKRKGECPGAILATEGRRGRLCLLGDPAAKPDFLVWGDSHSLALAPAVDAAAKSVGRAGLLAYYSACSPLTEVRQGVDIPCLNANRRTLDRAGAPDIKQVFLISRWATYAEGWFDFGDSGIQLRDDQSRPFERSNHGPFERGLARTVAALPGKSLVLVTSTPEMPASVPAVLAKRIIRGKTGDFDMPREMYMQRQKFVSKTIDRLQDGGGVQVLDISTAFCDRARCVASAGGQPLYMDSQHLNLRGASRLEPMFERALYPSTAVSPR